MSNTDITPVSSQAPRPPAERRLTASVLFLLAALAALGALATNIILPAFPALGKDLGVSVRELSATLTSFFLAFALGQLFVGPLSDRFGRQRLVLFGLVIFIIGCLICAVAGTLSQLIGGRIIQALGVCATSVLSRAIARDLFDGQELARALSLTMIAMAAAPGFSPLLGGAFNSWLGWRATFGFVGMLAVLLAFYYNAKLGETHRADKRSILSVSAILRIYWQLLVDRRFITPSLSVSLVIGALYAFFAMAPAILMTGFHFSPFELGLFFASTVFVVFGAGVLAPRLAKRRGPVQIARAGIIIALAGSVALLVGKEDIFFFSAALIVFLLGMGLINPLGTAIALQPFARHAGAASALLGFLQMGCAALSISIAAALPFPVYTSLGMILAGNLTLSFLVFLALRK
ncbi:DHA1 family bicyclomycin/chloramphenicol resistance-like MFS transporter [Advenella incenata]|uniref:Bcr/CflA family efflux transporter n=1 Tax=Advenella incenata TaxID=267800 RepID=A0A4Q7VA48_9BURK|nr:multidrug effflux MFS transporter [Advenella incenata]RZT92203.1 DHA1 family bicyclomycin/chloramphenicol resistance-like MFS transporter [Advenella incenata]